MSESKLIRDIGCIGRCLDKFVSELESEFQSKLDGMKPKDIEKKSEYGIGSLINVPEKIKKLWEDYWGKVALEIPKPNKKISNYNLREYVMDRLFDVLYTFYEKKGL